MASCWILLIYICNGISRPTQDPLWNQTKSPSWNILGSQLFKKHKRFPWNKKFHFCSNNNSPLVLSGVTSIQSTPSNPITLRSNLILCSYLRLSLTNGLYPSDFPTKTLYAFLPPYVPHALDLISRIIFAGEVQVVKQIVKFSSSTYFIPLGMQWMENLVIN